MKIPKNLYYSNEHEWVLIEKNIATIGITDFAQSQLGDIIFLELPAIDDLLKAGGTCGEIEAVKTVSDLFAPISGKVLQTNKSLNDSPEYINSDPYGKGWLIKIAISKEKEKKDLMSSIEYAEFIK